MKKYSRRDEHDDSCVAAEFIGWQALALLSAESFLCCVILKLGALTSRARDLANTIEDYAAPREIPRPACENSGFRDDAVLKEETPFSTGKA